MVITGSPHSYLQRRGWCRWCSFGAAVGVGAAAICSEEPQAAQERVMADLHKQVPSPPFLLQCGCSDGTSECGIERRKSSTAYVSVCVCTYNVHVCIQ